MKKGLLIAVLFLFAGAVLYLIYQPTEKLPQDQPKCNSTYLFPTNIKFAYELKSKSDIKLSMLNRSKSIQAKMDGVLNIRFVHRKHGDETVAMMQFSKLTLDAGDPSLEKTLKHIYMQPFIVVFLPDGRISKSYFKGNDNDSTGLRQLLDMFQIVLKDASKYTLNEVVQEGAVTARYTRESDNMCSMHKHRVGFNDPDAKAHKSSIVHSDIIALVDSRWLVSLQSSEMIEVYTGAQKVIESYNHITLKKNDRLVDDALEIWQFDGDIDRLIAQYKNDSGDSYLKKEQQKAQKRYVEKNGITLGALLLGIKSDDPLQMMKIADYITLYPDEAEKLFVIIKNAEDDLAAGLIEVLKRSGTPQAQSVLREITKSDEFNHMNHLRAVIALGSVARPMDESVDFLWNVYEQRDGVEQEDLSNTSLLSVSRLGPRSQKKEEVQQKLKDEYAVSSDDIFKKRTILLGMQNADSENFESEIFDALTSGSNSVKTAAIGALSSQNRDEVREKLLPLFNVQEDLSVRRKVVKTLLTIDTDDRLMSRAVENILKDDDNIVRKNLIVYLLKYENSYPHNIETLKQLREVERDKGNQILLIKNGF